MFYGHLLSGLAPAGVPRALAGYALPFGFNDTEQLRTLAKEYSGQIGAIILEPIRNDPPDADFVAAIQEVARIVSEEVSPITDHRSTEAYRRHAAGVLAGRLVERCLR